VRSARREVERVVLPSGQRRHVSSHAPCEIQDSQDSQDSQLAHIRKSRQSRQSNGTYKTVKTVKCVRVARRSAEKVVLPSRQRRHVSSHSPCENGTHKTVKAYIRQSRVI